MSRITTHVLAILAIVALAAGPAAGTTVAAGNAPTISTEPIDIIDVHPEPDGSVTTSRLLGTRTTFTFPDGRFKLSERYTDHQTLVDASGSLVFDSKSEIS